MRQLLSSLPEVAAATAGTAATAGSTGSTGTAGTAGAMAVRSGKVKSFESFVKLPNFFYATIGLAPYTKMDSASRRKRLLNTIFYISLFNTNLCLLMEFVNIFHAAIVKGDLLEVVTTFTYAGFVLLADFKMFFVWLKRRPLMAFMRELYEIFPQRRDHQDAFQLRRYLRKSSALMVAFSSLYMLLIWTYNLDPLLEYYIADVWLKVRHVEKTQPYLLYIPWDYQHHWSFAVIYAVECFAGYTSAAGHIANDLLLCASATQVIMHFDYIARQIETFQIGDCHRQNMRFLRRMIRHHVRILRLSTEMNALFGLPLFLNFSTSCFVICFLGFQLTLGQPPSVLLRLVLFFMCSIAQVYMICYYGEELIKASESIALAVYKQDFHEARVPYKKMLVLMALRAQKPATLKATQFLHISRRTMTALMQLSYRFFALLRTIYKD